MATYETSKNQMIDIPLDVDYISNGWRFENGKAIHSGINFGSIVNSSFTPVVGTEYNIRLNVSKISPGFLAVGMSGEEVGRITTTGAYIFTITATNNKSLYLEAGAKDIVVDFVEIYTGSIESETIVYDVAAKQYAGNISVFGDTLIGFFEDLIVFRNGVPWVQNKSTQYNTFFGEKFPSVIKYYCNIDYDKDKDFYSLTFNGSMPWRVDLNIDKTDGKSSGQRSRIKPNNFKLDKGKYVGAILRNMNDARFTDELQALMKGAQMQGKVMEVTITNNESIFFSLTSVEIDLAVK